MNRTRLLMIGVLALALGALVSLFVYRNLQGKGPTVEAGADVVVAANDIQVGARVEDHDVRVAKFPVSGLPAGSYTKKSQVLGRGVIIPVSRGEFILPSKLAPENVSVPFEMRQLLYGRKPHVYRILFAIEGETVYVLRIRHGRRKHLSSH